MALSRGQFFIYRTMIHCRTFSIPKPYLVNVDSALSKSDYENTSTFYILLLRSRNGAITVLWRVLGRKERAR